ncbi:RNA 3'-terminal phosphate cyclase-domain-containing protein [Xylaria bambusicola]|uniref:RNA 3'-terminal phosphate cyclase-domain-containing protein n=1 Tax=Xylaria bambusicola TaxID=326684 RepID=UPI0020088800|nr:RNA 3'-terminal phosphate cyclase-domain-containing protein [Xylaria bambusicola]KAI0522184.1 RNA 3'-terminal phosphate cyclase-domain-containing protein [Xylaria bambusicola]
MKPAKPILIDGSAGEGGGQLVRIACGLAAVTTQPIRIVNIRENRDRGKGLKSQHVSAIQWLATVTDAEVDGLELGSRKLEFRPRTPPTALKERKVVFMPDSPGASALLILQAVFPFLLFAGNGNGDPIEIEIHGSTNPSFSPSYEYLDQVFLPTLERRFGIMVERRLEKRAWTIGPATQGTIWLKFQPIPPGQTLKVVEPWNTKRQKGELDIKRIDISILVPAGVREPLEEKMAERLYHQLQATDINFILNEDSGHDARMYALAVAHSETGLRWGWDFLYDRRWKKKHATTLAEEIAQVVSSRLWEQLVVHPAAVDEYLQDQLVVFQALAEARTTYWSRATEAFDSDKLPERANDIDDVDQALEDVHIGERMRRDKTHEPFGFGSTHATTARWVTSELLPKVRWFNNGTICEGAGVSIQLPQLSTSTESKAHGND